MAKVRGEDVTLTIEGKPTSCSRCPNHTRVLIYPSMVCAECWTQEILRKYLKEVSELAKHA